MSKEIYWHGNTATIINYFDHDEHFVIELCNGEQILVSKEEVIEQDNPEIEWEYE